jgi:hypothetical protein
MTDLWTKFKITADFNSSVIDIYRACTTTVGLESWFLRKAEVYTEVGRRREPAEAIHKGDDYVWYWHGFPDDVVEKGKILDANGKDEFRFTFTAGCIVSMFIESKKGKTLLELTQENIPLESDPAKNLFVQCQTGWTFYLANLKSVMEGGIDLRNKREDINSSFK